MMMWQFLFKLFRLDWENPECRECNHLRLMIEQERAEKSRILNQLLEINRPVPSAQVEEVQQQPLRSYKPWSVVRQELEKKDRIKMEEIIRAKNSIENLEKQVGINQGVDDAGKEEAAL
jgi:ABC-type dipeptide/oligopeptide/nickel transport system ATPase subunit